MNIVKYLWGNKTLALVAAIALSVAVWLFQENYQIAIVSKETWVNYQLSASTYCDSACEADVLNGLLTNQ